MSGELWIGLAGVIVASLSIAISALIGWFRMRHDERMQNERLAHEEKVHAQRLRHERRVAHDADAIKAYRMAESAHSYFRVESVELAAQYSAMFPNDHRQPGTETYLDAVDGMTEAKVYAWSDVVRDAANRVVDALKAQHSRAMVHADWLGKRIEDWAEADVDEEWQQARYRHEEQWEECSYVIEEFRKAINKDE